jgi:hypothetical protein
MMDGAHRFVEVQIAAARSKRQRYWKYDASSADAWEAALRENRERLRTIIGAVDERLPPRMERFGADASPALVAETARFRVYQVRWSVLDGVSAEGLLVEPTTAAAAHGVMLPDCGQTPEQLLGLAPGLPAERQAARRFLPPGRRKHRIVHGQDDRIGFRFRPSCSRCAKRLDTRDRLRD